MNLKTITPNLSFDENYIKWDSKYKIGIPKIDQQHEKLVNLCNQFYLSLFKDNQQQAHSELVKSTLSECAKYAVEHFAEEERLMTAANFDGFSQHKKSHEAFVQKVLKTSSEIDTISFMDAVKFAKFLYDWVLSHIAHEDKLYLPQLIAYLKQNASK